MTWLRKILKASGQAIHIGGPPFVPTHRHKKGGVYRLLAYGVYEADRSDVAIYDDAEGNIWVRSLEEFEDGRFSPIS